MAAIVLEQPRLASKPKALETLLGPQGLKSTPAWLDAKLGASVSVGAAMRSLRASLAGDVLLVDQAPTTSSATPGLTPDQLAAMTPQQRINAARALGLEGPPKRPAR